MKKIISIFVIVLLFTGISAISLNAAAPSLKDGVYSAKSDVDAHGYYATIKITVKKGAISACEFKQFDKSGKEKDSTYGKTPDATNDIAYKKAQNALKISATFSDKLVKSQDANKIDGTTSATGAYTTFKDLVKKALAGKPAAK